MPRRSRASGSPRALKASSSRPSPTHNGYIYTGTWQQEEKAGTYFCLSTTDEDPTDTDETKYTSWRVSKTGGFYWVGAYATDNYVIFGSDNGKGGSSEYGSTLYSVNAKTGRRHRHRDEPHRRPPLRRREVRRYVYFTSKAGYLYRATVSSDGQLGTPEALKLDGMITARPSSAAIPSSSPVPADPVPESRQDLRDQS